MLPHTYTQTNKEVVLYVPLAADVRAKEVHFKCTSQQLSLSVRGAELQGEFFLAVKPDESTWELEDEPTGRRLRVGLCKARPNHKWDCCFLHEVDGSVTHRVFLDLSIAGQPIGRLTIGLYGNAVPRTAENFRKLCTGECGAVSRKKGAPRLHFRGVALHRIVPGFLCQGGDITHDRDGTGLGGASVYGGTFEDEGFPLKHRGRGELLMANAGRAHNNHSQFAITMARITEFESGHVIFGRVLDGFEALRLAELEGSAEGFTERPVVIHDCGELDARGEAIEVVGGDSVASPP